VPYVVPLQRVVLAEDAVILVDYAVLADGAVLAPDGVFEPPLRRRFVEKAPHIQPVLSRDQFDVLVRKPEVPGVTQHAMRAMCLQARGSTRSAVPLELKYRLRRANRD